MQAQCVLCVRLSICLLPGSEGTNHFDAATLTFTPASKLQVNVATKNIISEEKKLKSHFPLQTQN